MPHQRIKTLITYAVMGIDVRIAQNLYGRLSGRRPAGAVAQSMTDDQVAALVRQGLRWAFAAGQDTDLVVAHLHWNYAVAWFDIVAEAAPAERIAALTGVDIQSVREAARSSQDRVQRALIQLEHPGIQLPATVRPN